VIARGTGFPLFVIPGIQGRWEWMRPTIDALTYGHRVMTSSLMELRPDLDGQGAFLSWMRAVDAALDEAHERKVSLVGISFGGLIAACYAARRPDRVTSLVLVSTPPPRWKPKFDDELCMRFPRLSLPYFAGRALTRLVPELYRSRPSWPARGRVFADHLRRAWAAPIQPAYSAQWVREWQQFDVSDECRRVATPTLIITGESELDRVVRVEGTREYLGLIKGSTHAVIAGTGHLGFITKPARFAEIAGQFIYAANTAERAPSLPPALELRARHVS
jgi:pimeloyl-ACP methyl ester carboxylesterase